MKNLSRRALVACLTAIALLLPAMAQAQSPSGRPVRIIVGFPSGTAPDIVARLVAQKLQDVTQQPFVVENVAGAGGLIAAQQAAKAAPDGFTLFLNTVSDMSIAPFMYTKLEYNPSDFGLISHLVYADMVLMVPPKVPAQNLKDYVSWAHLQKPLFLATFGPGTPAHFGTAIFGSAFDLKPEPVHYKTTADAMSGVLSGEVPGIFVTPSLGAPFVKEGKLRAIATTSPARLAGMPDVPTFGELGYPQAVFASWFGLAAPPSTPSPILDRLEADAAKVMQSPDVRQKLEGMGFRVSGTTRDEFATIVRAENVTWGKAVRATGFKAD